MIHAEFFQQILQQNLRMFLSYQFLMLILLAIIMPLNIITFSLEGLLILSLQLFSSV